jgi:hypothetical protein
MELNSRNAHIVFLIEFAQTECNIALDNRTFANIFPLIPPRVHEIRLKAQTTRKPAHRLLKLTLDQEEVIVAFGMSEGSRGTFVIQKELFDSLKTASVTKTIPIPTLLCR